MKKNKKEIQNLNPKNEFIQNAYNEERKFSYINPVVAEDLNSKYIFWNYTSERIGRIMIISARIIAFILSIIYITTLRNNAISGELGSGAENFFKKFGIYIVTGVIIFEIAISFLYILPQVLVKKSNSLHSWGLVYIYIAVVYFIIWESIFIVTSAFDNLSGSTSSGLISLNASYIIFVIVILLITIILIVGGALLVSKSDDIRRQSTSE